MNDDDKEKLQIIKGVVKILDKAVSIFCENIDKPVWVMDNGNIFPRYKSPTSLNFQVLMAVRVVSGINASLCLIEGGYTQETGVIIRTIEEFISKIIFVYEMHAKGVATIEQRKLINEFFNCDVRSLRDIFDGFDFWVKMDKVFASYARTLSEGTEDKDTSSLQKGLRVIYDTYSGYVHGFYPHIMEMYEGGTAARFRTSGMPDTPRVDEMIRAVASSVHRALNTFVLIADGISRIDLRGELIDKRNEFQKSKAYKKQ